MKIIDLLNKIAKGEEVPEYIKYINRANNQEGKMLCCKENIIYKLDQLIIGLNDEIVEDKKYEDIEELGTNFTYEGCSDELTTIDWQISVISNKINALIRNQKKIIEVLNDNNKDN